MLIQFKVANFRSFKDEQTFSLVASNYEKSLPENTITPKLPGMSKVKLLRGAALYGANASGKSNLLQALKFVVDFVTLPAPISSMLLDLSNINSFRFERKAMTKPSMFELVFVGGGCRYKYTLVISNQLVHQETLIAYPNGRDQVWFDRRYDEKRKVYIWAEPSSVFKKDTALQDKTRSNSSFIHVAAQFNHPDLTEVFLWFQRGIHFLNLDGNVDIATTARMIHENKKLKDSVKKLLRTADLGVLDVHVEIGEDGIAKQPDIDAGPFHWFLSEDGKYYSLRVFLIREGKDGTRFAFNLDDDESKGTRQFFAMIGPFLKAMESDATLVVDEIETSLHPFLSKELVRLFISGDVKGNTAQLVYTTHNAFLLDLALIRRDQVWFLGKDHDGASHLYPLTDYKPRNDEALSRGYLGGRYGAVPYIPEGLLA